MPEIRDGIVCQKHMRCLQADPEEKASIPRQRRVQAVQNHEWLGIELQQQEWHTHMTRMI
jgi:hypothetical protein